MRIGSLCSGAGMLDMAVTAVTGGEVAWHCEVDPDASTVLAAHHPGVPNYGDLTAVDWHQVEPVDVLAGGWPCQPFSMAGQRKGADDERHLWPYFVAAIERLRPRLFFGENVPGLLTIDRGAVFGDVLASLHRLGYSAAWMLLGACKVGACHHRHRLYLAAIEGPASAPSHEPFGYANADGWSQREGSLFGDHEPVADWPHAGVMSGGYVWERTADPCVDGGLLLPTPTARIAGKRGSPSAETAARRMAEGRRNLEDAVALMFPTPTAPTARDASRGAGRKYGSGRPLSEVIALLSTPTARPYGYNQSAAAGAKVRPSLAMLASQGLLSGRSNQGDVVSLMPTVLASDHDGGPGRCNNRGEPRLTGAVQPEMFGEYAAAVARQELATGTTAPMPTEPGRLGRPRLAATFAEWMMALPTGYLAWRAGRKAAIRIAGNGVYRPAAEAAYDLLLSRLGVLAGAA